MNRKPLVVGIGGTLRPNSSSERALRAALAVARRCGADTKLFTGADCNFSPYDPSDPKRSDKARELVEALRIADGVILASPSYHGSISGLLKNALDYTEDLRTDVRPYLTGRAVGIIVCAEGIQALGSTLATLRSITHALRGWPTPFAATINSSAVPASPEAVGHGEQVDQQIALVAEQVVEFASMRAPSYVLTA
jgi:FMN reductase